MTLFELIFILLFLGSVIGLLLSAFLWERHASKKILLSLAASWAVYLAILAATDVFHAQRVFRVGEEECFDEMCFAVTGMQSFPSRMIDPSSTAADTIYVVKIQATSHSRGRAQAEGGLRGRLYDGENYIGVSEAAQKAYDAQHGETSKLTDKIAAGESVLAVLVFEAPQKIAHPALTGLALTLDHGFTPGYFVIGESPFFHQPDIHQLPESQ